MKLPVERRMLLRRLRILSVLVFISISAAAQTLSPTLDFKLADLGSVSYKAVADALVGGYTRIQVNSGILPDGMAILKYRQNGVLVSQAAVPAMPLMTSGRTYATINAGFTTGMAIVNPNPKPVTITFYFTFANGNMTGQGSTVIPANSQLAAFLNEPPFNVYSGFFPVGSFTFIASSPVSAIAFLRFINERNEVLLTTFQVTDLSRPPAGVQAVAHFVFFLGFWQTYLVFVNPTDSVISGTVQAFSSNGQPQNVVLGAPVEGVGNYRNSYTIPPRSAVRFQVFLEVSFTSTPTGSVRITPVTGSAPSVTAFFVN